MLNKQTLYLVAVPIGNFADFTLRGIETLKQADIIIGEERATTEKILKRLSIENKEILLLNEHNELAEAQQVLNHIVANNLSAALISEAGTPCIADPGATLVELFHKNGLPVVPIPGVSSVMTALMVAGVKNGFKYHGFLSPNTETRRKELKALHTDPTAIVILETPYRMKPLLKDIYDICGKDKRLVFAYKLTQPEELIIKDKIEKILDKTAALKKGEFVIVLLPNK